MALYGAGSADDALADRAEDEHGEVDEAADDHDHHAEQERDKRRPGGVKGGPAARVDAGPGERAGDGQAQHDRRETPDENGQAECRVVPGRVGRQAGEARARAVSSESLGMKPWTRSPRA